MLLSFNWEKSLKYVSTVAIWSIVKEVEICEGNCFLESLTL